MTTLEFTTEELEVLRELLDHTINDVEVEVFRTDTSAFKKMLKHRREVLESVATKLRASPVASFR